MKKTKRKSLFRIGKFQKIFFYPAILAFVMGCAVAWLSLVYFYIGDFIFNLDFYRFQKLIILMLLAVMALMIVMIFWVVRISSRYLGSYERILNELDDVIAGKRKGPLKTRKGDVLFEQLLKRVNVLIEKK